MALGAAVLGERQAPPWTGSQLGATLTTIYTQGQLNVAHAPSTQRLREMAKGEHAKSSVNQHI